MNAASLSFFAAIFFLSASFSRAQTTESPNAAGAPPKFLNMVRVGLKPGRGFAYAGIEAAIARGYSAAKVEVYWLTSRSLTGPSEFLYLNFFNSFEEYEALFAKVGAALAAHPEILQIQERLQQENGSSEQTVIAIRRDDLGYRMGSIDFSKMRRLRIREFHVRPGHDGDFAEAAKIVAAAYDKVAVESPWVVYQADSGAVGSTFFVLYPMRSLTDWDSVLAKGASLSDAQAEIGGERLPKILLEAISSAGNQMYAVAPEQSHMPKEFTEGDPDFWTPQPSPPAKPHPAASPVKPAKPPVEKKPR